MVAEIIGFSIGVSVSEVSQWGKWKALHSDQPWLGFWKIGGPQLMANGAIDLFLFGLWGAGLVDECLDLALHQIPFVSLRDIHLTGMLPFSPQVGVVLGLGSDMVADQLAFLFQHFLTKIRGTP